jgi:hypothetical protein
MSIKNIKPLINEGIYLLKEERFIETNRNIYKIGRSNHIYERVSSYENGTIVYLMVACNDSKSIESELIKIFNKYFKNIKYYGNEYFYGDVIAMKNIIFNYIKKLSYKYIEYINMDIKIQTVNKNNDISIPKHTQELYTKAQLTIYSISQTNNKNIDIDINEVNKENTDTDTDEDEEQDVNKKNTDEEVNEDMNKNIEYEKETNKRINSSAINNYNINNKKNGNIIINNQNNENFRNIITNATININAFGCESLEHISINDFKNIFTIKQNIVSKLCYHVYKRHIPNINFLKTNINEKIVLYLNKKMEVIKMTEKEFILILNTHLLYDICGKLFYIFKKILPEVEYTTYMVKLLSYFDLADPDKKIILQEANNAIINLLNDALINKNIEILINTLKSTLD